MGSNQFTYSIPTRGIILEILVSRVFHSNILLRDVHISLEELKSSIAQKGLLHPIIVRPAGDRFEVVAGNRRFAACKELEWKRITCHVLELDDKVALAEEILNHSLTRAEVRRILQHEHTNTFDFVNNTYFPSQKELELHEKEKTILRFITTLRIALMRLDDSMEGVNRNDWTLWQNLMHYRTTLHKSIDELIVLQKKSRIHYDKLQSIS